MLLELKSIYVHTVPPKLSLTPSDNVCMCLDMCVRQLKKAFFFLFSFFSSLNFLKFYMLLHVHLIYSHIFTLPWWFLVFVAIRGF